MTTWPPDDVCTMIPMAGWLMVCSSIPCDGVEVIVPSKEAVRRARGAQSCNQI